MHRVLEALNMSATPINPTFLVQILDVSLARVMRAGYCADQLLRWKFHAEDFETDMQGETLWRKASIMSIVRVWYTCVESKLICATALKVGQAAKIENATAEDDAQVRVSVGQHLIPFGPCREDGVRRGLLMKKQVKKAGELKPSEAEMKLRFDAALQTIKDAYLLRQRVKRRRKQERKLKKSAKDTRTGPTKPKATKRRKLKGETILKQAKESGAAGGETEAQGQDLEASSESETCGADMADTEEDEVSIIAFTAEPGNKAPFHLVLVTEATTTSYIVQYLAADLNKNQDFWSSPYAPAWKLTSEKNQAKALVEVHSWGPPRDKHEALT